MSESYLGERSVYLYTKRPPRGDGVYLSARVNLPSTVLRTLAIEVLGPQAKGMTDEELYKALTREVEPGKRRSILRIRFTTIKGSIALDPILVEDSQG